MKVRYLLSLILLTGCSSAPVNSTRITSLETIIGAPKVETRMPADNASLFGVNFDGCYQMLVPGAMYPAFCLFGTTEEGINGSGVRMVVFGTNTNRVIACLKSSASGISNNEFFFEAENAKQLILKNISTDGSKKPVQGDVLMGRTALNFVYLSPDTSANLVTAYQAHRECQNVEIGQVRNFN